MWLVICMYNVYYVYVCTYVCTNIGGLNVSFNQTSYSITENVRIAQLVLILNNQSTETITVKVSSTGGSANGKH